MSNRTIAHPPRHEHEPQPQVACMCESSKHFPSESDGKLGGHHYGCKLPEQHVRLYTTNRGVLQLCTACALECFAGESTDVVRAWQG